MILSSRDELLTGVLGGELPEFESKMDSYPSARAGLRLSVHTPDPFGEALHQLPLSVRSELSASLGWDAPSDRRLPAVAYFIIISFSTVTL